MKEDWAAKEGRTRFITINLVAARNEPGYRSPVRGFRPPDLRTFVAERTAPIESQLAGKSTGYVFTKSSRTGSFGRRQPAIPMLVQGDVDKDGALSKEEFVILVCRCYGKGKVGAARQGRLCCGAP